MLSPLEIERAGRFAIDADRDGFLAARMLARVALGSMLSESPRNLSHTPGLVACAETGIGDVGVDVEEVRAAPLDVADRFFSPPEIEALGMTPAHEQSDAFYTLWTLKESFVKARGDGLSMPLDSFAVGLRPPRLMRYGAIRDDASRWHFTCLSPTKTHRLAVCVRGATSQPPSVVATWLDDANRRPFQVETVQFREDVETLPLPRSDAFS
jgi:4'-phosphopantetheinyl transferase